MTALPAARLETLDGRTVPLQGVSAHGRLAGLAFELTVEQRYRNASTDALESVYTFPLPLNAVLLSLELELNGERHIARAVENRAAEREYERAVDDGNSAALLEDKGNGLYTVSLANLRPGEEATLRYRYAELLSAHRGYVRLQVPTVIAPRYGNAAAAGLEGPATPQHDWLVEYPFALQIDLEGMDDASAIRSPSHSIRVSRHGAATRVCIERNGSLDRDFVLELDQALLPQAAQLATHGGESVALASFTVPESSEEQRALRLKLLLDCSGSMQGARIDAARRATCALLERLDARDLLSVTRFGSRVHHLSEGLEPMDESTREALSLVVRGIKADLGGTEIAYAVEGVIMQGLPEEQISDILLVTDGEIHDLDKLVEFIKAQRHRLFVVAIGAAPNEALARRVSSVSGGACEFIADDEDAEGAILRMMMRLRSAPCTIERIQWPGQPVWTTPLPSAVFPGETVHVMAGFVEMPAGAVSITNRASDDALLETALAIDTCAGAGDLIPRLAAARRLATLTTAEATTLAIEHQLASRTTSFVLVAERSAGEKVQSLPRTVAVPQMQRMASPAISLSAATPRVVRARIALPSVASASPRSSLFDALKNFIRQPMMAGGSQSGLSSAELRDSFDFWTDQDPLPASIDSLASEFNASGDVISGLRQITRDFPAFTEAEVVMAYLGLLAHEDRPVAEVPSALQGAPVLSERRYRELRERLKQLIEGT